MRLGARWLHLCHVLFLRFSWLGGGPCLLGSAVFRNAVLISTVGSMLPEPNCQHWNHAVPDDVLGDTA
jgi:hypothetical protein